MAIEKKFPSSAIDVMYKSDMLLQKWGILSLEEDRRKLGETREGVTRWMKDFTLRTRQQAAEETFL
jgi:hypothetical protein